MSKKISEEFTKLNDERISFMNDLIKKNPNTLLSKILLSMIDPEIPESPKTKMVTKLTPICIQILQSSLLGQYRLDRKEVYLEHRFLKIN